MYGAYLSYAQLNQYMSFLLEAGLVKDQKSKEDLFSSIFVITDKGKHFLDIHNKINEMVTVIQNGNDKRQPEQAYWQNAF